MMAAVCCLNPAEKKRNTSNILSEASRTVIVVAFIIKKVSFKNRPSSPVPTVAPAITIMLLAEVDPSLAPGGDAALAELEVVKGAQAGTVNESSGT